MSNEVLAAVHAQGLTVLWELQDAAPEPCGSDIVGIFPSDLLSDVAEDIHNIYICTYIHIHSIYLYMYIYTCMYMSIDDLYIYICFLHVYIYIYNYIYIYHFRKNTQNQTLRRSALPHCQTLSLGPLCRWRFLPDPALLRAGPLHHACTKKRENLLKFHGN